MVTLKRVLLCAILICCPSLSSAQQPDTLIRTIGIEDGENSPYLFGQIVGLALDAENNIYVLDRYTCEVRVFTWKGDFLRVIGRGKGVGPGEFMLPMGMSIGADGLVYIADWEAGRIVLYQRDGKYLDQIPGIMPQSPPSVLDEHHIFMARGGVFWTRPMLLQYSRAGELLATAVEPIPNARGAYFAGANNVSHALASDGNLVVVRPYPYEIMIMDKDLNIQRQWMGEGGIADSPPVEVRSGERKGAWTLEGQAIGVSVGPDARIYINLLHNDKDERRTYLDVYESDGSFLTRILTTEFGIQQLQFFTVGPDNLLLFNQWEPFPQIWFVDLTPFMPPE